MKIKDMSTMSESQLITQLCSFKKESMNLRFSKASSSLQDTSRIRIVKRSIARINTMLSLLKKQSNANKIK